MSGATRTAGRRRWTKLARAIARHAVMLAVSTVVLIPIVMVVLGSFKTVPEFFDLPYGLPEAFDPFNY